MGNTSAGRVGAPNEGQTDMGRGNTMNFSFSMSGRKTGRVSAGISSGANSETVDANKRVASDPRLA